MPGLREADCSEGWSEAGEGYSEGGESTEPETRDMVVCHLSCHLIPDALGGDKIPPGLPPLLPWPKALGGDRMPPLGLPLARPLPPGGDKIPALGPTMPWLETNQLDWINCS